MIAHIGLGDLIGYALKAHRRPPAIQRLWQSGRDPANGSNKSKVLYCLAHVIEIVGLAGQPGDRLDEVDGVGKVFVSDEFEAALRAPSDQRDQSPLGFGIAINVSLGCLD